MPCAAATILEAWRIDRLRWVTSFEISLKTTLAVTGFFLKCRVPFRVVVFLVIDLCFEVEVLMARSLLQGRIIFIGRFMCSTLISQKKNDMIDVYVDVVDFFFQWLWKGVCCF